MAFSRSVFPILVLSVVSCYANLEVPVFLWGDVKTSIDSNHLSVPESVFKNILSKQIEGDHFTVIFADKSLSVEDFSRKNDKGKTLFPYLKANIGHAVYLPAVEKPLSVLKEVVNPQEVNQMQLTDDGLSGEAERESAKILLITLEEARVGESRDDLLLRHNNFMQKKYSELQNKYKQVLAIYTANSPSIPKYHSRVRRQAVVALNDYNLNGLKLYVQNLVLSVNDATTNLTTIASQSSNINNTEMQTILNFGENTLTLNFTQSRGYWYFNNVVLEQSDSKEILYPKEEVYSIVGFSYRCGQNVIFSGVNNTRSYSVHFQNLKVQPFFIETNESQIFGDSLNCVGFFTVPIWSGLFVTFILLAITFYGIMMMMDIRTMDRFDDPKGKTITINANE